jgi:hypothetical protein
MANTNALRLAEREGFGLYPSIDNAQVVGLSKSSSGSSSAIGITGTHKPLSPGQSSTVTIDHAAAISRSNPRALKSYEVMASCQHCSREFVTRRSEISRGKGKYCSPACSNRGRDKAHFRKPRPRYGPENGNWKGGFKAIDHVRKFKAENPEKALAHRLVYEAGRSGKLRRPCCCSVCGSACKPDAHHEDYSKPLEVVWLCRKCHGKADADRAAREHGEFARLNFPEVSAGTAHGGGA